LFTAAAAVFVEVAKRRTLRDIKLAADAMPYSVYTRDAISVYESVYDLVSLAHLSL
jgi:hypothetical protein